MAAEKPKSRFSITRSISPKALDPAEFEAMENLLARLIARAILHDHLKQSGTSKTNEKGVSEDA